MPGSRVSIFVSGEYVQAKAQALVSSKALKKYSVPSGSVWVCIGAKNLFSFSSYLTQTRYFPAISHIILVSNSAPVSKMMSFLHTFLTVDDIYACWQFIPLAGQLNALKAEGALFVCRNDGGDALDAG